MRSYYVYILRCSDGTYYIGITNDVTYRVAQHQCGMHADAYTHNRRPVALVYVSEFRDVMDAIAWEKRIKRWSRRKKEVLIRGAYEELPSHSLNLRQRRIQFLRTSIHNAVMVRSLEP